MTLKKLLRTSAAALGALAVASVTQATAADMYAGGYKEAPAFAPPPIWAGFYFGAHMGIDWANVDLGNIHFDDGWGNVFDNHRSFNSTGGFGGAQLGYNFQYGPSWVYGIEVDLGGATLNGNPNEPFFPAHGHWNSTLGWLKGVQFSDNNNNGGFYGDVDGRLGYTWGTALLYFKGGFSWLETNFNRREGILWSSGWDWTNGNNNNNTLTGFNVGGGIEWKVAPAWSIKAEYLHVEFNNLNNNCCNDNWGWTTHNNNNNNLNVDTVKIGFNYFWNPAPPAPLK